jgi:hypothetical protein
MFIKKLNENREQNAIITRTLSAIIFTDPAKALNKKTTASISFCHGEFVLKANSEL